MEEKNKKEQTMFIAYEYKDLNVKKELASFYLDCYENFGWQQDENFPPKENGEKISLKLKRNRKIVNKVELTRLQRHFEADMEDIFSLENSKTTKALIIALTIGILGTAFMAGSVFAVTATPPIIWLCIILAIPGFAGWILPYFAYKKVKEDKARKVTPYIEEKYDEIYEICEKGHSLL
ncbi:hypothetical protein ACTQWG_03950 [Blautia sp. HCP3S3_H10_1]|uniref:hypothetical protein n=1 Tax=unclassified Blautia TaxID=2648079 RepID=UPI003F91BF81